MDRCKQEPLRVLRSAALPGSEMLEARNAAHHFRVLNTDFAIAVPTSWVGEVWYRRRRRSVGPGQIFCPEPGEIHTALRIVRRGNFCVWLLEPAAFQRAFEERSECTRHAAWRAPVTQPSPQLLAAVQRVFRAIREPHCSSLEVQSAAVQALDLAFNELVTSAPRPSEGRDGVERAAALVRECLYSEAGAKMDLEDLARATGLSRFQVLRSFKRRYGLPPHAYQVCVRVGLAQRLLRQGASVTQAATAYGFADTSHFARHLRRSIGVSPTQYAGRAHRRNAGHAHRRSSAPPDLLRAAQCGFGAE